MSDSRTTVKWWDNGVGHSFFSRTIPDAEVIGDQGWVTVEVVLIRLNTTYTPSGKFPVYSNQSVPDATGAETRIGYDAAVCVQKYEPWIIEAYNTTIGSPSALRIVQKGDGGSTSLPASGDIRGFPLANTRFLNTTGKIAAFYVAHDNSVNQITKDNGRDFFYVPSPTVGSAVPSHNPLFSHLDLSRRPFLSPMAQDLRDIPNYLRIGSPLSVLGSMRPTFYHTSRGRHPSSRNRTRTGRSRMSLTGSGSSSASRCLYWFWESSESCSCRRCRLIYHGEGLGFIVGWRCCSRRYVSSVVFPSARADWSSAFRSYGLRWLMTLIS